MGIVLQSIYSNLIVLRFLVEIVNVYLMYSF